MALRNLLPGILACALLAPSSRTQRNVAEQYLFAAANQECAARGIPLLRLDPALTEAATRHAAQMAAHRGISHQPAGEPELSQRGSAAGAHFSLIAENVGESPSPLTVHDAWMRSPGHRENLLDPRVDSTGVAVIVRGRQLYAVQDFAHLTRPLPLGQQEARTAYLIEEAGLTLLPDTAQARIACTGISTTGMSTQSGLHATFVLRYTTSNIDRLPEKIRQRTATREFHSAAVGACPDADSAPFAVYRLAILLYP